MANKHVARFPDGTVLKRTSRDRRYTHAYLIRALRTEEGAGRARNNGFLHAKMGDSCGTSGFSGSRDLAAKALGSEMTRYEGNGYTVTYYGIVETEVS